MQDVWAACHCRHSGTQSIGCSYKAVTGYLYPLERGFIFVHKPPVHIRFDEVESVNFARSAGNTRSFDFDISTITGSTYTFVSIEKWVNIQHCWVFISVIFVLIYVSVYSYRNSLDYNLTLLSFIFTFLWSFFSHLILSIYFSFIFSERELMFTFAIGRRPSVCLSSVVCLSVVCLSSVCNVRAPYSADWNFRQCFCAM